MRRTCTERGTEETEREREMREKERGREGERERGGGRETEETNVRSMYTWRIPPPNIEMCVQKVEISKS